MNKALDTLCYIQEQTSFLEDYEGNFGYEVHDKGNRFYVTFPAVLQSFGRKNRNGRIYDMDNIWNCIQTDPYIKHCLATNQWLGEMDHPEPEKIGEELTMQRISKANLGNTSHYIHSPSLDRTKQLLNANIQTDSSTSAGMNMAIKIVDGKIVPCFSARLFGSKEPGSNKIICKKVCVYDWVQFPSHDDAMAQINQPVMESAGIKEVEKEIGGKIIYFPELAKLAATGTDDVKYLCEAFDLTEEDIVGVTESGNSVVLTEKENVYVQPISDVQIRKMTKDSLNDWLNN